MAFKEGARKASQYYLEPIMKVEVVTPEEYMGDVMGDLKSTSWYYSRYGRLLQLVKLLHAEVPLVRNVWLCNRFAFMQLKDVQLIRWSLLNMTKLQQILLMQYYS